MAANFIVELQALPFEGSAPVLEEAPCEAFTLIAPQLTEGLLEQVGVFKRFAAVFRTA
jgi:hypothetical protein